MRIRNIVKAALLGCMAVVIAPSAGLAAQAAPAHQHAATAQATPPSGMAAKCQAMMAGHDKMMAETKAADATLDALVKDMNAAAGEAKINAMTAVVNELVRQNKAMHERMGQMHQQMMGGRGMMMPR